MSFSVNYLVFCVPTLHINNYRNRDIVLNALIAELITLGVKHHMAGKVPKSKDFYKVSLCSNTTVSTWLDASILMSAIPFVCGNISPRLRLSIVKRSSVETTLSAEIVSSNFSCFISMLNPCPCRKLFASTALKLSVAISTPFARCAATAITYFGGYFFPSSVTS